MEDITFSTYKDLAKAKETKSSSRVSVKQRLYKGIFSCWCLKGPIKY